MATSSNNSRTVELEDVFLRLLHGFARTRGEPASVEVAATACGRVGGNGNYYKHIFHDSCTTLTLQFLHAVVPILARHGISNAKLPNGQVVPLSAIKSYRGNYVDSSIPIFGRISHDILGVEGMFVDISGAQFRGERHPTICWFDSVEDLHASFQGRPLQSFRELSVDDITLTLPRFDNEVKCEMEKLVRGDAFENACAWCSGKGSKCCPSAKLLRIVDQSARSITGDTTIKPRARA